MGSDISAQRRMLTTTALLTFALGIMGSIERDEGLPSARFFVGMGFAFTMCSAMLDFGSPIGGGFAMLIFVSALLYQGQDVLHLVNRRAGKRTKRTSAKPNRGGGGHNQGTPPAPTPSSGPALANYKLDDSFGVIQLG